MNNDITKLNGLTIGMDLGDRESCVCVLDDSGEVLQEFRVATTTKALQKRFSSFKPARIAIETGTHCNWIACLLEKLNHEAIVADARSLKLISHNMTKNDRMDAKLLARLARADVALLNPVRLRSSEAQADMAFLHARDALVSARTKLVNHIRGKVKSFGYRLPSCSARAFPNKVEPHIPEELQQALQPLLSTIISYNEQILEYDKKIEELCADKYPITLHLRQIKGVGPITALAFVLTVDDPLRFSSSRTVGSYLGLRPRQHDSGERSPQLRITKAGNTFVRRLLVSASHYILGPFGPDTDLRRWGLKLAERGGKAAKKRAVVATARKLAVLMHRLWVSGEVYQELDYVSRRVAKRCA